MKLNTLDLVSYATDANGASFVLANTTMAAALALDGQTLTVTDANGEHVETFAGYSVASVAKDAKHVILRIVRTLDDRTAEAIQALETNTRTAMSNSAAAVQTSTQAAAAVAELGGTVSTTAQTANAATIAVAELGATVSTTAQTATTAAAAIGELGQTAATAQQTASTTAAAQAELGTAIADLTQRVAALEAAKA